MKDKLLRLFEGYWVNSMIGGLCFAIILGIALNVAMGQNLESQRVWIGIAMALIIPAMKGDKWLGWICQSSVSKPSIKLIPNYRYLLGTENRELLKVGMNIAGKSYFKIHIPEIFLRLEYESPNNKQTFPLIDKTVTIERTISKGRIDSIPVDLKFVDQYFHNDVINSYTNGKNLKLSFEIQYSAALLSKIGFPTESI